MEHHNDKKIYHHLSTKYSALPYYCVKWANKYIKILNIQFIGSSTINLPENNWLIYSARRNALSNIVKMDRKKDVCFGKKTHFAVILQ